jgi:hypothetical protein
MGISRRNEIATWLTVKIIFICLVLFTFSGVGCCLAGTDLPENLKDAFRTGKGTALNAIAEEGAGYKYTADFQTIVGAVVTLVLGLLGVVFLVLAIYAGYSWMTAGGNEETVEKAKKTIVNSIIGIIVVLAAYALSRLIVVTFGSLVFE